MVVACTRVKQLLLCLLTTAILAGTELLRAQLLRAF